MLLVILVLICGNTKDSVINNDKLLIHQTPSKELITVALNIVVNKLDKEKIYTKQQMLNVLNGHYKEHDCNCKNKKRSLIINFTMGEWFEKEKRYCLLSNHEKLKGKCYAGFFKNYHTVEILSKSKIHQSSFAHELLHYFKDHINGPVPFEKMHEPKEFWENLVGFGVNDKIGILNEELKEAGL
jgi:hypothetical protein